MSHELQLDRLITGYWVSQLIYVAARLEIADLLKEGPRSVEDLAEASAANADALYRVLRGLASVGIFTETDPRHFALTPSAEPLRKDVPGSKYALALMTGDEQFRTWAELEYSVRTGKTAFDHVYGKPIFQYLGENPSKAKIFDAAMVGIHGREVDALLNVYDFSQFGVLADIGGGNGSQIRSILKHTPGMKGILFDLPHVIERAESLFTDANLADRCQRVGGNFFESVPAGANAYVLRHIIHDWDDESCLKILNACHAAMPDDAKLLIVESVIPAGNDPFGGKLLDIVMMLIPGGKERTELEYQELLTKAGFRLERVVPTDSEISIVEASKV
ncbi:methyltransferase [Bremerella cremea]|uniref:methyltransferase n=1 Tax=Bremerella cremea TaxID=1031537 RepID=UPI0031EC5E7B